MLFGKQAELIHCQWQKVLAGAARKNKRRSRRTEEYGGGPSKQKNFRSSSRPSLVLGISRRRFTLLNVLRVTHRDERKPIASRRGRTFFRQLIILADLPERLPIYRNGVTAVA